MPFTNLLGLGVGYKYNIKLCKVDQGEEFDEWKVFVSISRWLLEIANPALQEFFNGIFEQRNQPEIIPLSYLRICQVVQVSTRTNERQRLGTDTSTTNDREGDKYSNSRSEEY